MNVHLGPALDSFVEKLLRTGLYQTQSEILREGLRLLKEREDLKRTLRREIKIGTEQAERGQLVDGRRAFARIRKRSAERRRMPA